MRLTSRPTTARLLRPTCSQQQLRTFLSDRIIQENDVVLLKQRGDRSPKWRLTPPLRLGRDKTVKLPYGATVAHEDLVGRRLMDSVVDSTGRRVVIYEASMANHITHSERKCAPIYPHDANTIVSMMDIHVERPGETEADDDGEAFEVFEAGTGAGSLTLHIARALHAANPPLSPALRSALSTAPIRPSSDAADDAPDAPGGRTLDLSRLQLPEDLSAEAARYVSARRAVLHTLDRKAAHSLLAHATVRRFRRGMYLPNVDFHAGASVEAYLTSRLDRRGGRPFLSRAVLDLPAPEDHAGVLLRAMRPNAVLVAFSPSVSQIAALAAWSARGRHPLRLDRVAELPTSSSAEYGVQESDGGRAWNISTVVPKEGGAGGEVVQIMRPRVGDRIAGGGFVAVLRRIPDADNDEGKGIDQVDERG